MSSPVPPPHDPQPSGRPHDPYGATDPYRTGDHSRTADPYAAPTTPPGEGPAVPPPYAEGSAVPPPYGATPAPHQPSPGPYEPRPYESSPYGTGPYGAPAQPGTDGFAITALVTGLLGLSLVAVGFGIAALRRIGRSGRSGKGLAIAGIVLGAVSTVAWGLIIAFFVALAGSDEFRDSFAEGLTEGFESMVTTYAVGQCMDFPEDAVEPTEVPCSEPHTGEIVGVHDMTDPSFPGDDAAYAAAEEFCLQAFADYVGIDFMDSELDMMYLYPTETSWDVGDRQIACWAEPIDGTPLTESVAGAAW